MLETVVSYEGGLRCRAEHEESGTIVLTDAPKDIHGQGASFSPSEMLSVSLGSCVLSMLAMEARSMNLDIVGAVASVTKEMTDAPRRIARMSVTVRIPGTFDERQRMKLEAAAHTCPVHNALGIAAPITIDWVELKRLVSPA